MNEIKKVGIIAMPILSTGGGFNRTAIDLISELNSMGKEVHLLNPFNVDLKKIKELYGAEIKIEKIYSVGKIKSFFCREETLGRKLLIKKFRQMAMNVDFIIDMDGTVFHNCLPQEFKRENYVVWKISCINSRFWKFRGYRNYKMVIKSIIKEIFFRKRDLPVGVKIYPIDEWTKRDIINAWKIQPRELCLYSEIKTDDFIANKKKKRQIVILGRIAPNKNITDSIKIFYNGTKKYPSYELIIIGGATSDTEKYVSEINELTKELKIEERVRIIKDPSFDLIKNILSESEIIIDSQGGNSMHMPVIEAMSSGVMVLMQKNSGTYLEVLEGGKYGEGFDNIEEGGEKLEKIISDLKKRKINNKSVIKRAEFFSPKNFRWRLRKILDKEE